MSTFVISIIAAVLGTIGCLAGIFGLAVSAYAAGYRRGRQAGFENARQIGITPYSPYGRPESDK